MVWQPRDTHSAIYTHVVCGAQGRPQPATVCCFVCVCVSVDLTTKFNETHIRTHDAGYVNMMLNVNVCVSCVSFRGAPERW